jgi:hypothetical protein
MVIGGLVILLLAYFSIPQKKPKERALNFSKNKGVKPQNENPSNGLALNVFFNFNGHSFDAYEALGVPAGSTIEEIQVAFKRSIQGTDAASQEFYSAALQAIQQTQARR